MTTMYHKILEADESDTCFTAFLNTLTNTDTPTKDVSKRIGVAKNITFPSNFDEIDYGTSELFRLDNLK